MAAEPENVSFYHGWWSESDKYGHDDVKVNHPKGYSSICDRLLFEFMLEQAKFTNSGLKLKAIVSKIEYSTQGTTVTTRDGRSFSADAVILTCSIGVLNSNLIDFVPALPAWKKQAFN